MEIVGRLFRLGDFDPDGARFAGAIRSMRSRASTLNSNWEIVPYLLLDFSPGLIAPWFLRLLNATNGSRAHPGAGLLKMFAGGIIVGGLAVFIRKFAATATAR